VGRISSTLPHLRCRPHRAERLPDDRPAPAVDRDPPLPTPGRLLAERAVAVVPLRAPGGGSRCGRGHDHARGEEFARSAEPIWERSREREWPSPAQPGVPDSGVCSSGRIRTSDTGLMSSLLRQSGMHPGFDGTFVAGRLGPRRTPWSGKYMGNRAPPMAARRPVEVGPGCVRDRAAATAGATC
jgi:hypothetical protein